MVILLINGPPGVGKTAVARALLPRLGAGVLLDAAALAAFPPEDWLDAPYRRRAEAALLALLDHHRQAGCEQFIVTGVYPDPAELAAFEARLAERSRPVFSFRLACTFADLKGRILACGLGAEDPTLPLRRGRALLDLMNAQGGEAALGRVIQTTGMGIAAIADRIGAIASSG